MKLRKRLGRALQCMIPCLKRGKTDEDDFSLNGNELADLGEATTGYNLKQDNTAWKGQDVMGFGEEYTNIYFPDEYNYRPVHVYDSDETIASEDCRFRGIRSKTPNIKGGVVNPEDEDDVSYNSDVSYQSITSFSSIESLDSQEENDRFIEFLSKTFQTQYFVQKLKTVRRVKSDICIYPGHNVRFELSPTESWIHEMGARDPLRRDCLTKSSILDYASGPEANQRVYTMGEAFSETDI